jgi:hypothetical protein
VSHDDALFGYRLRVFTLAEEIGVRPACRRLGVRHSTYYRWKRWSIAGARGAAGPRGPAAVDAEPDRPPKIERVGLGGPWCPSVAPSFILTTAPQASGLFSRAGRGRTPEPTGYALPTKGRTR